MDIVQKKRMLLMGFNPAYASLIYAQSPEDFNTTIEVARRVEIEYNYAAGATSKQWNKVKGPIIKTVVENNPVASSEVEELSRKLKQLTVSYANLTSVLVVQNTTTPEVRRTQSYRSF